MTEYCDCPNETQSGHVSLTPVAEVWVHGECLRPSREWYYFYWKECEACGNHFSNPIEEFCSNCLTESNPARSWQALADAYRNFVDVRDAHFYMNSA